MIQNAQARSAPRMIPPIGLLVLLAGFVSACGDDSKTTSPDPTARSSPTVRQDPTESSPDEPRCKKEGHEPGSGVATAKHLRVFFWCAGQLRGVDRLSPSSPQDALELSIAGPTADEVHAGYEGGFYSPDIRGTVRVLGDGTALVDLDKSTLTAERFLASSTFAEKSLAATLEALPDIEDMRIVISGRPLCDYTTEC